MKKRTAIFVFVLATSWQFSQAQWYVGPRAGASISNITTPTLVDLIAPDIHYLPGFEWGVSSEYEIGEHFSVMAEAIYREKGFRIHESTDLKLFDINIPLGVRVDTRLRYIDVPVMAKYSFGAGPITGFVAAGPQVSYAVNGNIRTKANFLLDVNLTNLPIRFGSNHPRFDVGGVAAAGLDFNTGRGKIFIDARYNHGFLDSFQVPVVEFDIRNHGFGFGVGYKVQLW